MGRLLKILDLFAGCGGLTSGFVGTGRFESVLAVESDLQAAATFAANFGDHVFVGDVAERARGSFPRVDVVVGGPPCQGFSALGRRESRDPRNRLWRHYVEIVRRVRPAFFVLENVPPFMESSELRRLREACLRGGVLEGFEIEASVIAAEHHGVPQARRRTVVIGRRRGMEPVGTPEPGPVVALRGAFPGWLADREPARGFPHRGTTFRGILVPGVFALTDLHVSRPPSALSLARYRAIPPGGARRDLPDELKTNSWRANQSSANDVMGRLRWQRPAVTIRTEFFKPEKGRFLHPDEDRPITHAEAAVIQGFPEEFRWCGSGPSIARQIGNAVPPPLAGAVARRIADRIA